MNKWRTANDLKGYLDVSRKYIYVVDEIEIQARKLEALIKDEIKKHPELVLTKIPGKGVKAKIQGGFLWIWIADKNIEDWFQVMHFDVRDFLLYNSDLEIKGGELQGDDWCFVTDTADPRILGLTRESGDTWKQAMSEMRRRLVIDLSKKTRKLKVGHKYSTMSGDFVVIATVGSHRLNPSKRPDVVLRRKNLFIVTWELDPKYKTTSEVYKSLPWMNIEDPELPKPGGLYIISKPGLCVEGGEVLKDDITGVEKLWPSCAPLVQPETVIAELGRFDYSNLEGGISLPHDTALEKAIRGGLEKVMYDHLWKFYETGSLEGKDLTETTEDEVLENALVTNVFLYCQEYLWGIKGYYQYIDKLFDGNPNISLLDIAKTSITKFKEAWKITKKASTTQDLINLGEDYCKYHLSGHLYYSGSDFEKDLKNDGIYAEFKEIHNNIVYNYGKLGCSGYTRYFDPVSDCLTLDYIVTFDNIKEVFGGTIPPKLDEFMFKHKIKEFSVTAIEKIFE